MIKEFKNGNIHIKLECDLLDNDRISETDLLVELINELDMIDVYNFSDVKTYGNFDCCIDFINIRINKAYTLLIGYDLSLLKRGKTLILNAYTPNNDQLDEIKEAGY